MPFGCGLCLRGDLWYTQEQAMCQTGIIHGEYEAGKCQENPKGRSKYVYHVDQIWFRFPGQAPY